MENVLPDASSPYTRLQVNGLTYRYTMEKDPDTDAQVSVRNEDSINGGYVFNETDNWNGQPGATIQKYFRFPYIDSARWGDGEIAVEGEGNVTDPIVTYNYRLDIDEQAMRCAANPLADPSCPGYMEALLDYLNNLDSLTPDDPFYDEWVQAQLEQEAELEDEEITQSEEKDEESLEKRLGGDNTIEGIGDNQAQAEMLAALAAIPKIESYYTVVITGGEYKDTIKLEDTDIPDNKRAMSNLASDAKHRTMIRSQYEK